MSVVSSAIISSIIYIIYKSRGAYIIFEMWIMH